jgi:hypothetical protein
MEYYKNNILVDRKEIAKIVADENPLDKNHEGIIIHSRAFDLNAHAKYKILQGDVKYQINNDSMRIFVPCGCSKNSLQKILANTNADAKIELDIRSYFTEGADIIDLFMPFLHEMEMQVRYNTNIGIDVDNVIYFHLKKPYVFTSKQECDKIYGRFYNSNDVTVIVDRKTLHESDIYSAIVLTYFSRNFNIIGELHKSFNKIFRVFNCNGEKFRAAIGVIN